MADVGPRDGGQLLLVGAFGLAVLFVVLALVLNAAVHTTTLASRDGSVPAREVETYQHDVRLATADVLAVVNRHNDSSDAAVEDALRRGVADVNDLSARHEALDGRATHVGVADVTLGRRIEGNATGTFTNRSGAANWTLATDSSGARRFRMNVSRSNLSAGCGPPGGCFEVVVTDGTDEWRLSLWRDGNGTVVAETAAGTCNVTASHAVVDPIAGTVGGTDCAALTFADGVTAPYDVQFERGDQVEGDYVLVVNTTTVPAANYDDTGAPTASPMVYAATVDLAYEQSGMRYETEIRVTPGERDD